MVDSLKAITLKAAALSREWSRRPDIMEGMDGELGNALFQEVVRRCRGSFDRFQLESFKPCLTNFKVPPGALNLDGNWMAILGRFRKLVGVDIEGAKSIRDDHMTYLSCSSQLQTLNLKNCSLISWRTLQNYIIFCTRLTDLNLSGTNIFPDSKFSPASCLTHLTSLTSLRMEHMFLNDRECDYLRKLKNLRVLSLAWNDISVEGAMKLTALSSLTCLDLTHTAVCAVPILPDLKVLKMNGCYIREGRSPNMYNLLFKKLERIEFNYAELDEQAGWSMVEDLIRGSRTSLLHIDLCDSNLIYADVLCPLTCCTFLDLSGTPMQDADLATLTHLTSLTQFNLNNNIRITSAGVRHISKLPLLASLSFRSCPKIDSSVFVHLTRLVNLKYVSLNGSGVSEVRRNWRFLNGINGGGIVMECARGGHQPHVSLEVLEVADTQWTDEGASALSDCFPNLRELRISSRVQGVTDATLWHVGGLTRLEMLAFKVKHLTDEGLRKLWWSKALKFVDLTVDEGLSQTSLNMLYSVLHSLQQVTLNGQRIKKPF